jgi:hypothetical protein
MSSTTDKNTPGNYAIEQFSIQKMRDYDVYSGYGVNSQTCQPGDGLLAGKMNHSQLAYNGIDIESFLRGINSTNLVTPSHPVIPRIRPLKSLCIFDKPTMILPKSLKIDENQRPKILN